MLCVSVCMPHYTVYKTVHVSACMCVSVRKDDPLDSKKQILVCGPPASTRYQEICQTDSCSHSTRQNSVLRHLCQ